MRRFAAGAENAGEPSGIEAQVRIDQIYQQRPPSNARFTREPGLEGEARPGDVLMLAGGDLMRDLNENGLVDGWDEPLKGALIDVRG